MHPGQFLAGAFFDAIGPTLVSEHDAVQTENMHLHLRLRRCRRAALRPAFEVHWTRAVVLDRISSETIHVG